MTEITRTHSLQPPLNAELALVVGGQPPRLVPLLGRQITIGRDETNDVVLPDRFVSSRHCQVSEERGRYLVRDLGSRNGTRVNGVVVQEGALWPGATLGVGQASLLCVHRPTSAVLDGGRCRLVGESPVMHRLKADLARFAARQAPVLLQGESGTGKELAARAIHQLSSRGGGPYVSVNCGALTSELALSELFGHERGAFTGAASQHRGAFEQAIGGTLFLDEVGELEQRVQVALLRTLETGTIRRVGSERELPVDVRVVSATNRDLLAAAQSGGYRLDLYHRLAVLRLDLPPLRRRLSDVPALARALLARSESPLQLSEEALRLLSNQRWPGNVRELRNVLERACALAQGDLIRPEDLCFDGAGGSEVLYAADREVLSLVTRHGGNVAAAARVLGVSRSTLRDRVHRLRRGPRNP